MTIAEQGGIARTDRPAATLTGIVVSHTHWDREWYLTFERFRMRMVDMLDLVLDILDRRPDFGSFTLDGQTVLLEDYLAVRPEQEGRIRRHVRDGRLLVGPWYVLSDGFLASGETMVRNLLIGGAVARRFGEPMPVGYLPDNFGHPSQLPQLLAGFGIEDVVVYRGVRHPRSEFWWEAPDGTRALTAALPEGYCNANVLSTAPQLFDERMPAVLARLAARATTNAVLIMNGCDHMSPRPELADHLAEINGRMAATIELRQGTLAGFLGLVRRSGVELDVVRGEFRSGRPGRVLPGVISARSYLKQANFRATTLLERGVEPLASVAWLLGEPYPKPYLDRVWRLVLQNTPHDSITGCSVDPVHREMEARYAIVEDVAGDLAHRAAGALAARVATGAPEGHGAFLAFNPLPFARREQVRARIHFLIRGTAFHVVDAEDRVVPLQVLSRAPARVEFSARFETFDREAKPYPVVLAIPARERAAIEAQRRWQRWEGEEAEILFTAELPATGYATYRVVLDEAPAASGDLTFGEDWAENAFLRVAVHPDGTFDLTDKRTGAVYPALGALESGGDRGDEYTFCPPEEDAVATTRGAFGAVRRVESGPARIAFETHLTLSVPKGLGPDRRRRSMERVAMPVVTRVALTAGSDRVEVATEVDNLARDHRLRAVFPAPLVTDVACAQGLFTVDTRPIELPPAERERVPEREEERDEVAFPHKAFVDVGDGRIGLAVLNRGVAEYEVEREADGVRTCITLLRAVGWLSRPDLTTRHGDAGPEIETPDAQCPGRRAFEYAVVPHGGDWLAARVHRLAEGYVTPVRVVGVTAAPTPSARSFVAVEPHELVPSALKKADAADALVLRFYNTASHEVRGRVTFGFRPRAVRRADLAERAASEALPIDGDGGVSLRVRGGEICTLLIDR